MSGKGHRYEWEGPHDHTISHDTLRINPMCCSRPQTKQQKPVSVPCGHSIFSFQ